jgi:hypothetical protein
MACAFRTDQDEEIIGPSAMAVTPAIEFTVKLVQDYVR